MSLLDNVCPDHPTAQLIEDARAGDVICSQCGLVVGDRVIDVTSEWRTFANDEGKNRSRVGDIENTLLGSSDLSTNILNPGGKNGYDMENSSIMKSVKGSMSNSTSNSDRNLTNGFREITLQCNRINIAQNIQHRSQVMYKKVYDSKILRGKPINAIAASCIFLGCREENVPRSYKEICAISNLTKTELGRCVKKILRNIEGTSKIGTSDDYLSRFVSRLGLKFQLTDLARNISKTWLELDGGTSRSPISIAAASLYMAILCAKPSERKTLQEICKVTGAVETTVKTVYKLMAPRIRELIPKNYQMHQSYEMVAGVFG